MRFILRRLGSGNATTLLSISPAEGLAAVLVILAPRITACAGMDIDDGHSNAKAAELASHHQGEIQSVSLRQHRPQAFAATGFLMCGFTVEVKSEWFTELLTELKDGAEIQGAADVEFNARVPCVSHHKKTAEREGANYGLL
jgi:hypothetical protein